MARSLLVVAAVLCLVQAKRQPENAEMEILKDADPKIYGKIRGLMAEQKLGMDMHHHHAHSAVNSAIAEKFKMSSAEKDRQEVLELEKNMMSDRASFAASKNSHEGQLAQKLAKPKVAPIYKVPSHKHMDALLDSQAESKEEAKVGVQVNDGVVPQHYKRTHVADTSSWGDMKAESSAIRTGKSLRAVQHATKESWGDFLTGLTQERQQGKAAVEATPVAPMPTTQNKLSSFSWGSVEDVAEGKTAPKKELGLTAANTVLVPHVDSDDMPDQLKNFLGMDQEEVAAPVVKRAPKTNNYLSDLA